MINTLMKGYSEKMKIVGTIGGAFGICFTVWTIQLGISNKPGTLNSNYKAAEKEFMKFQKLNPMQGIGRGL